MRTLGGVIAAGLVAGLAMPAFADGYDKQFKYSTAMTADGVDWTGMYAGLHTGGVSGKTIFVRQTAPTAAGSPLSTIFGGPLGWVQAHRNAEIGVSRTVDIEGFHVGPHIGYQKQFGQLVLGGDLGFSIGGGDGKKDCGNAASAAVGGSVLCESEYKYSVNARGRVGYATGNYLFYGTAGVVRARIENQVTYTAVTGEKASEAGSAYPNGYLVGIGAEFQSANGMRWGLGYTHIFLENVQVTYKDAYGGGGGFRNGHDPDVLGGSLRIPLQQQAPAIQDPGPPAAQAPAVAQAQVAPAAAPGRPVAAPPAVVAPPPGAATPVPGTPAEPGEPAVKGRPSK